MKQLRDQNPQLPVYHVTDRQFIDYGRLCRPLESESLDALSAITKELCPASSSVMYLPSIADIEDHDALSSLSDGYFGGMEIQVGCCWGKNRNMNGMEYHKSSELILTFDDIALFVGRRQDICESGWDSSLAEVFFIPAGSLVEIYITTLHLAPAGIYDAEFHTLIILPKGTNYSLPSEVIYNPEVDDWEKQYLFRKNKWMMAHPDSPSVQLGARIGITGNNLSLTPLVQR